MIIHPYICHKCGHQYSIYYNKVKGDIVVDDAFIDCSHCGTIPNVETLAKEIKYYNSTDTSKQQNNS